MDAPPGSAASRREKSRQGSEALAAPPGGLEAPVTVVNGISTALAAKFGRLGVKTVRDLLTPSLRQALYRII